MKWKNKGHELDEYAVELEKQYHFSEKKLFVFGTGVYGKEIISILRSTSAISALIDNDINKQKEGFAGFDVLSLDQYLEGSARGIIIVATNREHSIEIKSQLNSKGLHEQNDYIDYAEFKNKILPIYLTYYFDMVFVDVSQICLTERCSLKCEKCAHGCFNVDIHQNDSPPDNILYGADMFFSKVDLCNKFVLIGGEPLLYKEIGDVVEYIGKKYREQIVDFSIATNGTIIPDEVLLEKCRKYNVVFEISNYSKTLPFLKDKLQKLSDVLQNNDVGYRMFPQDMQWIDMGFDWVDHGENPKNLENVFDACKTFCREIRGYKYFFCFMSRSTNDNLRFNVGMDDYLDFEKIGGDGYKKIILEFNMGYSQKGYLDMCRYCNGIDAYKYPIPAAKQKVSEWGN